MDEFRVKGIVIYTQDYKDNDKLITIYTLELGRITAVLKGVKSKNAKLKFAGQLFCFANFILVKRGEYFTVTNAEQIESFYEITSDYNKFLVGQIVLESLYLTTMQNVINEKLFIDVLKALKLISYSDLPNVEEIVLVKFILSLLSISGYEMQFKNCGECGMPLNSEIYFNFDLGFITCKTCSGFSNLPITQKTFSLLKIINQATFDQIETIKIKDGELSESLVLLSKNFENKIGKKLKTFSNYFV